jgi:hypothetical protein
VLGRSWREADAEQAFREAAAGDPLALEELSSWLSGLRGRQAEAARIERTALMHTAAQSRRILTDEVNRRAKPRMVVESCRTALV